MRTHPARKKIKIWQRLEPNNKYFFNIHVDHLEDSAIPTGLDTVVGLLYFMFEGNQHKQELLTYPNKVFEFYLLPSVKDNNFV